MHLSSSSTSLGSALAKAGDNLNRKYERQRSGGSSRPNSYGGSSSLNGNSFLNGRTSSLNGRTSPLRWNRQLSSGSSTTSLSSSRSTSL